MAALLVCFVFKPGRLRHLIFTDRSPMIAIGPLLYGFILTFGSAAIGSAIMAMERREEHDAPRGSGKLVRQEVGGKGR